jgi:hypothetical protein
MSRSIANPRILWEGEAPAEPPNSHSVTPALRDSVTVPQVTDLLDVLSTLHELLNQLLELARDKLDAMRHADALALHRCAAEECGVLERLLDQEHSRNAALARLAQTLHWNDPAPLRLADIAQRLPEPLSSRLRARTAGLRRTADELRQKNRLAAEVARHLHDHIRAVFEDLARVNQESVVYGPRGNHEQRTNQTWVDAVG